jgi:hypothetical protein
MDKEYEQELNDEIAMEEGEGSLGNDNPDSQEDCFQTPIEQHNTSVRDNNEIASNITPRSARTNANPIVTLINRTNIIQERDKRKKKETTDQDNLIEAELDNDDTEQMASNDTKPGVETTDDSEDDNETNTPKELGSDLGPYWSLGQSSQAYVMNTIATYNNIEASKSTPQYGFNKGLKEFGSLGYEATVKELDDKLLGMGAVQMLKPSEIGKIIQFEALNYLMFLKRKRCGKSKGQGVC